MEEQIKEEDSNDNTDYNRHISVQVSVDLDSNKKNEEFLPIKFNYPKDKVEYQKGYRYNDKRNNENQLQSKSQSFSPLFKDSNFIFSPSKSINYLRRNNTEREIRCKINEDLINFKDKNKRKKRNYFNDDRKSTERQYKSVDYKIKRNDNYISLNEKNDQLIDNNSRLDKLRQERNKYIERMKNLDNIARKEEYKLKRLYTLSNLTGRNNMRKIIKFDNIENKVKNNSNTKIPDFTYPNDNKSVRSYDRLVQKTEETCSTGRFNNKNSEKCSNNEQINSDRYTVSTVNRNNDKNNEGKSSDRSNNYLLIKEENDPNKIISEQEQNSDNKEAKLFQSMNNTLNILQNHLTSNMIYAWENLKEIYNNYKNNYINNDSIKENENISVKNNDNIKLTQRVDIKYNSEVQSQTKTDILSDNTRKINNKFEFEFNLPKKHNDFNKINHYQNELNKKILENKVKSQKEKHDESITKLKKIEKDIIKNKKRKAKSIFSFKSKFTRDRLAQVYEIDNLNIYGNNNNSINSNDDNNKNSLNNIFNNSPEIEDLNMKYIHKPGNLNDKELNEYYNVDSKNENDNFKSIENNDININNDKDNNYPNQNIIRSIEEEENNGVDNNIYKQNNINIDIANKENNALDTIQPLNEQIEANNNINFYSNNIIQSNPSPKFIDNNVLSNENFNIISNKNININESTFKKSILSNTKETERTNSFEIKADNFNESYNSNKMSFGFFGSNFTFNNSIDSNNGNRGFQTSKSNRKINYNENNSYNINNENKENIQKNENIYENNENDSNKASIEKNKITYNDNSKEILKDYNSNNFNISQNYNSENRNKQYFNSSSSVNSILKSPVYHTELPENSFKELKESKYINNQLKIRSNLLKERIKQLKTNNKGKTSTNFRLFYNQLHNNIIIKTKSFEEILESNVAKNNNKYVNKINPSSKNINSHKRSNTSILEECNMIQNKINDLQMRRKDFESFINDSKNIRDPSETFVTPKNAYTKIKSYYRIKSTRGPDNEKGFNNNSSNIYTSVGSKRTKNYFNNKNLDIDTNYDFIFSEESTKPKIKNENKSMYFESRLKKKPILSTYTYERKDIF